MDDNSNIEVMCTYEEIFEMGYKLGVKDNNEGLHLNSQDVAKNIIQKVYLTQKMFNVIKTTHHSAK